MMNESKHEIMASNEIPFTIVEIKEEKKISISGICHANTNTQMNNSILIFILILVPKGVLSAFPIITGEKELRTYSVFFMSLNSVTLAFP